jgi:hypothetical protein
MNQQKYRWLFFLLFVLLISNIILAAFLFVSNSSKEKNQNKNEANSIYKEIGLDSIQIDTFKARKEAYFKQMRPLWNEIKELKDSMYKSLEADSNDLIVKSLSSEIANKTSIADMKTYQHFYELRKFCTPDQQLRYDTIIPKLVNRRNRR